MVRDKILVVDDDQGIRELLHLYLESKNFNVLSVDNGLKAIEITRNKEINLILLDIKMPGMSGFDVCEKIREFSNVPIIFLSSTQELTDRIKGIKLGADDFLMKPFDFEELEARIRAIFRRNKWQEKIEDQPQTLMLELGGIQIDLHQYKLQVEGKNVPITNKEFLLLVLLAEKPNRIWTAEQLYNHVWGYYSAGDPQTVKVHISNLRRKIELNPTNPKHIKTVRGFGYKFVI